MPKLDERDLRKAEFATTLQRHLSDRGWSQSDLARAATEFLPRGQEFRRDNISVYLRKMALPRPKQLVAIAKALRVEPGTLLPGFDRDINLPYFTRNSGTLGRSWLHVSMEVPTRIALHVISLLDTVDDVSQERF